MGDELSIKDTAQEQKLFAQRALMLSLLMLFFFILLLIRFVDLQIFDHQKYQTKSENNRIHVQPISPLRGLISDRNGELLAGNLTVYNLAVISERAVSLNETIFDLRKYVSISDIDLEEFKNRLKEKQRPFEPIPIKFGLSEKEIAVLAANRHRFRGIEITTDLARFYPYGPLFAHAVGSVRRITKGDLKSLERKNYSGTRYVGKVGVEKRYETKLHGKIGFQRVETDAHGRVRKVIDRTPSRFGSNITLYLDVNLQAASVRALGQKKGAVVAIDPSNGGVLALVSKPAYDPNSFINGMSTDQFDLLTDASDSPFFNRAINGQYAPGSIFKPIVGLAGLANNVINWNETIEDKGEFRLPNQDRLYRDWSWTKDHSGGQGVVNLRRAIYRSSNVYFYTLANKLQIQRLRDFSEKFGIGQNRSFDIQDASAGLLPDPQWKRKTKGLPWYPGDTVNMGIGQGDILVTPLQMAVVASVLANRGRIVKPRMLVPEGPSILGSVEALSIEGLTTEDWEEMVASMEDVIHLGNQGFRGNGTAWAYIGRDISYRMAGKSGTAQIVEIRQGEEYSEEELDESQKNHAWFIAFAPVVKPKIAIAVLVENGGGGSSVAGPVARKIIDAYLMPKLASR